MPGKRKNKRRRRKKNYKKVSMYAKGAKPPVGNRFKALFRYVDTDLTMNPAAAGLLTTHVFSCNGLFDPDITGTGHQPMPFDDLMGLYDHYTVIGTRIRVDFHNTDTTNPVCVGVFIRDSSSSPSDPRNVLENGNTKWKLLAPKGSGKDTGSLTLSLNPNKFLGRGNPLSEDNLRGSSSANPDEGCFYHIFCCTPDAGDGGAVDFVVTIEYTAILTEPRITGLS